RDPNSSTGQSADPPSLFRADLATAAAATEDFGTADRRQGPSVWVSGVHVKKGSRGTQQNQKPRPLGRGSRRVWVRWKAGSGRPQMGEEALDLTAEVFGLAAQLAGGVDHLR